MEIKEEQLAEAIRKYPVNGIAEWYMNYFLGKHPEKYYVGTIVIAFIGGFIGTAINIGHRYIGWFTYLFCVLFVPLGVIHISSCYGLRIIERKRARYLGIKLKDYFFYKDKYKM